MRKSDKAFPSVTQGDQNQRNAALSLRCPSFGLLLNLYWPLGSVPKPLPRDSLCYSCPPFVRLRHVVWSLRAALSSALEPGLDETLFTLGVLSGGEQTGCAHLGSASTLPPLPLSPWDPLICTLTNADWVLTCTCCSRYKEE